MTSIMKRALLLLFLYIAPLQIFAQQDASRYPIIPKPISITPAEGTFTINTATKVLISPFNENTQELASCIANFLSAPLGSTIETKDAVGESEKGNISIVIDEKFDIEPEGYHVSITPDIIRVKASTITGAFWAFQTLRQLLPAKAERGQHLVYSALHIPCASIKDAPRFAYRGLMLDVGRHMFSVPFIKKCIDTMACYKLNTLHWHLTEDQGWRVEIKKYPKLQEIAAYRTETLIGHKHTKPHIFDGRHYGGYYTQQEIKDIIEYARTRHITIIPEIELPGHSVAALAAYPELGCTGGPYTTSTIWGIHHDIYCAGNEKTFEFLENVLFEIIELFPSTYIHIGGDEAPKTRWKECPKCQARMKAEGLKDEHELQSYFVSRIAKFVNSKERRIIGWDEILEGGIAQNATVMSWRGTQGGIEAARLNHNVIMTPYPKLYFDLYQSQSIYEPLAIQGYSLLKDVYEYEPIPSELNATQAKHILGAQANIWTEYIKTSEHIEYMTYPRALALAEISWSPAEQKNYDNFLERLHQNIKHLRAMHVAYAEYENN